MLHLLQPCFARMQQSQMVQAMHAPGHDLIKAGLATALRKFRHKPELEQRAARSTLNRPLCQLQQS